MIYLIKLNFTQRMIILEKKLLKKKKYFKLFNETKISKYLIDISLGNDASII